METNHKFMYKFLCGIFFVLQILNTAMVEHAWFNWRNACR